MQTAVLFATIVGTGLIAGLFAAFSYSVMPGLGRSSDRTMVEAMQNINKAIMNPLFMLLFLGTGLLLIWALVLAWRQAGHPALWWIVAALVLYAVAFFVTSGANVPLNDKLAKAGTDLAAARRHFENKWVAWNAVRAVLHTASFGCATWALVLAVRK